MLDDQIEDIVKKYDSHQDLIEITKLYRIVEKIDCKTILEIGTGFGGTFRLWSTLLDSDGFLLGIDLRGHINWEDNILSDCGNYKKYKYIARNVVPKDEGVGCEIKMFYGKSQDQKMINSVSKFLIEKKREIDFLFIDGGHDDLSVSDDYYLYSPLVRKGGIIAFHDILSHGGVHHLWNKLSGKKYEIINRDVPKTIVGTGYLFKE